MRVLFVVLLVVLAGCAGPAEDPATDPTGTPSATTGPTSGTTPAHAPPALVAAPAPSFVPLALPACAAAGPGLAWGDVDRDGLPDLWTGCDVLRNDNGSFTPRGGPSGRIGAWADVDGDGCLDLAFVGEGQLRLGRGDCAFGLTNQRLGGPVDGLAWSDVDRDGRPDLLTTGPDWTVLLHNDNGSLASSVLTGPGSALLAADLDGDRYPDVLVAGDGVQRLRNLANGEFTNRTRMLELPDGRSTDVAVADLDRDGRTDLVTGGPDAGAWRDTGRLYRHMASFDARELHPGDLNHDGLVDLVGTRDDALVLLLGQPDGSFEPASTGLRGNGTAALALADMERDGDLDIAVAWEDGRREVLQNEGAQGSFLQVVLHGNISSTDGLGSVVRVQERGRSWAQEVHTGGTRGADEAVAHVGLGRVEGQVDLVEVLWSSGIRQVLLEVDVNVTVPVDEEPTTKTSCPLVFAWDGQRMAFESDAMGTAYIGWHFAPGEHWEPDPTYRLRLRNDIQPRDGAYEVRLMEALEEIDYLDMARLTAVDHPEDVLMLPDERFMVQGPDTGFGLAPLATPRTMQAWHDGTEVTDVVARIDGRMTETTPLPMPRFEGLGERHVLELDLGGLAGADRVRLAGWGWVYYPMTLPLLSAEGPYVTPEPPRVEALDPATGAWVLLSEDVGFPVGLPKWWTYDLDLPPDTQRVRMSTNLLVQWDQLLVDTPRDVPARVHARLPDRAVLDEGGYPQYVSQGLFRPGAYTYDVRAPHHVWDLPEGDYTRLGDVTPLLQEADDRFVVFKHGDEVTLRFDAGAFPPVPEGWERSWFLDLDGFFKDMDPHNAFPETVGPLPFHGMSNYPYGPDEQYPPEHAAYLAEWNTRRLP